MDRREVLKGDKGDLVQFWAAVGPIMVLFTLLIASLQGAVNIYSYALISLLAVPVCWQWRLKGWVASSFVVLIYLFVHESSGGRYEQVLDMAYGLSTCLSLLITALCYEESGHLFKEIEKKAKGQLDTLLQRDDEMKDLALERGTLKQKNDVLESESQNFNEKMDEMQQLLDIARNEIVGEANTKEKNLQELISGRHHIARLEEEVEEIKKTQRQMAEIQKSKPEYERKIATLKKELDRFKKGGVVLSDSQTENLQTENSRTEKNVLPSEPLGSRRFDAMYKQLREQFEEKSKVLDETRKELFAANERILVIKKDFEDQSHFETRDLEEKLQGHIVDLEQRLQEAEKKGAEEVAHLEEVISRMTEERS